MDNMASHRRERYRKDWGIDDDLQEIVDELDLDLDDTNDDYTGETEGLPSGRCLSVDHMRAGVGYGIGSGVDYETGERVTFRTIYGSAIADAIDESVDFVDAFVPSYNVLRVER